MGKFEQDLKRAAEVFEKRASLVVRKVGFDLYRKIVMKTPFKTGRARGNWMVSIGSPATGTTDRKTQGPSVSEVMKANSFHAGRGSALYIVNNLDYISALEDGHSKTQAPHGMMRISVLEYPGVVKKAVNEAKFEIKI